ncbi:MAG TPA: hypothetical protein VLL98_02110 [Rickettsiales bacterium]|nr:hypothetical protein [Rickettsiales bacterium]
MKKKIISSLLLATLVTACSGKKLDYTVTDYSHDKKPVWIQDVKKYEKKKENEGNKYKYFTSDGESVNKRLCEKSAIVNTNITIAGEISNEIDDLYTGLTEVQMEELTSDTKKEETKNRIKNKLVGVELRDNYWEKRKYSTELGADKDKITYYCYQLSRVKKADHDKIIKETFDSQLKKVKNKDMKQEITKTVQENAEDEDINL